MNTPTLNPPREYLGYSLATLLEYSFGPATPLDHELEAGHDFLVQNTRPDLTRPTPRAALLDFLDRP